MNNTKQLKYILFDAGNVLIYKVTHESERISKLIDTTPEEYLEVLNTIIEEQTEEEKRDYIEMGTLENEKIYLDKLNTKICKRLNHEFDDSLISQMTKFRMNGDFALKGNVIETLKKLSKKYTLGIFSNALPSRRCHELKIDGLDKYFRDIFISREIGFEKPDPEGYKCVLNQIGYEGRDIMFVDDKIENLDSALSVGITDLVLVKVKEETDKYPMIDNIEELPKLLGMD